MRDLRKIPETMLQERAAALGDTPPAEVTVKISKLLGVYLMTQAELYDRDVEYIARQTLELWAEDWARSSMEIYTQLQAAKVEGDEPKKRRNEHYYKCELAASLRGAGLNVRTEFHTGNGDADIAIMDPDGKTVRAIVEVKLGLKNWRECHQATGQAKAYAEATGAPEWFVVAESIEDERFVSDAVLRYDGAADSIVFAIRKAA